MRLGWFNVLSGLGVAATILGKAVFGGKPTPRSLQQRLAMLPCANAPVAAEVTIRWNDHQVPFIEASSENDLMVALGVVHAHLRLGQMELMRRIAYGRVAEMIGPMGIELDRSLRQFDFGRAVPQILAGLSTQDRQCAESFVAGINHVLLDGGEKPAEFSLLHIGIEPWTLTDLFTAGRLGAVDMSWMVWARLLPLRERLAPEVWAALWPRLLAGDMPATATAPDGVGLGGRAVAAMLRSGSNSAAVAARRSRTGGAMIANDPHLSASMPNAWLIVGMHAPGLHCVGLMMPGLPFPLLGRNPWIAWGGTSLHAQSSDLYDVSTLPAAAIRERSTTVRVRGARTRQLRLRESEFGPIVSDGAILSSRQTLALRWMGHLPSNELGAMLAVARARDWESYRQALSGFGVSGANMVFAGGDGRVAHVLAAHLPVRPRTAPADLVLPMQADVHWRQVADINAMPIRLDPPEGFVASANEAPPEGHFPVGYFFAPLDRAKRLASLLGGDQPLGVDDLRRLQRDVAGPGSLRLRDVLLAALPVPPPGALPQRLWDALRQWDGNYARDSTGALAFELLLAGVAQRLSKKDRLGAYQDVWMTQHLLQEDFAALPAQELRRTIERALPAVARKWRRHARWGAVHRIHAKHILGFLPSLGRFLNAPAFEAEGGNNTVHKNGHSLCVGPHEVSFGSSARHISDLSDLDANDFVLLGGQDGWAGSANYADQLALWQRGDYIRVPLRPDSVRAAFTHSTTLRPVLSQAVPASVVPASGQP
ncbi:MAG: penicillin acylase family protein [Luteimonas sp.]